MNKLKSVFVGLFSIFSSVALGGISISPGGPYSASAGFGQTSTVNLTVSNDVSSPAVTVMDVFEGDATGDLAGALTSLNENQNDILETLTNRYFFSDGVIGTSIGDGGRDMYDGGNYLRFGSDTNPALVYSDNVVADSADASVSYFTRKFDGLFVLAADYKAHTSFHITGNLGADGRGWVAMREFDAGYGYRAFVKTVWSAGDPSVNHLILVPDGGSLVRTSPTTTHYDTHSITGLEPNGGRLYHLLFAKEGGAQFPIGEIEALATTFLRSVRGGPPWFSFPQDEVVNTGSSRVLPVTLDARGLEPGVYTTRFTIDEQGTKSKDLPASAFHDLSFTVEAPSFTPAQIDLNVAGLEGVNPDSMTMDLTPASGGALLGTLQINSDEAWVTVTRVSGENRLLFTYDTDLLAVGEHSAEVAITQGTTTQVISLYVNVSQLNVVKLLPDPTRAKIYGINQDGKSRGSLLVINTATQTVERNIPLGLQPSDMDLTEGAAELLVLNASDPSIYRIDLSTLMVVSEYALTEFETRDNFVTGHVADGPGDIIYYVDEQWGPRLRVFDTSTETVLQAFGSESDVTPNTLNDGGFGGIRVTSDRSKIYGWKLYGGNTGTHVAEFVIEPDGTLSGYARGVTRYDNNFRYHPYDTPVLLTTDDSRLIIKDRVVDQTDLDVYPTIYPDEIYAISSGGEIASGARAIYSGESGNVMHEFSNAVPVQAITPDNSTLVYFEATSQTLIWLDLNTTLGTSGLSLTPAIGDGSHVIGVDQTLSWGSEPKALSYHVYFGTSEAAVMYADSSSAEYLGSLAGNTWDGSLPALALGSEYFWRVDMVGLNDSRKGDVWSFNVSPIMVSPIERSVHAPLGAPIPNQTHQLSSSTALSWTASSTTPWISVVSTSGTTNGTLTYGLDSTGLTDGTYTGAIQITSGGVSFDLPVSLVVYRLNVIHMQNTPSAGSVLALSQTSQSEGPSFLLDINPATGGITRFIEAGINATDFDVATNENRIYFANYGQSESPVVDLDTWSHLTPLNLDASVHYLEATPDGLLILEPLANRQTVLYDPADGSELISEYVGSYNAHGKLSPDGDIYYRQSGAVKVAAYRFDGGAFVKVDESGNLTNSSRSAIVSDDGSHIFYASVTINAELETVASVPQIVYATDGSGTIAIGERGVYWARSGQLIHTFSNYSYAQAVSSDDQYLVRFSPITRMLESVRVDSIVTLPGVSPQPGEVLSSPPTELSVPPVAGALGYQLFMGTSPSDLRLVTTQTSPQFSMATPLSAHSYYYWRVDAGSPSGRIVGDMHGFSTVIQSSPVELSMEPVSYVGFQDQNLLTGRTGYSYHQLKTFDFDPVSGGVDFMTSHDRPGSSSSSSPYGSSVVMAGGDIFTIDAEGLVRVEQGDYGDWIQSDSIPVDSSPNLVRGLRADGDLLFVSADDVSAGAGNRRIHIYRTFPQLVLEHTIEVPTSEAVRDFGSVFEVSGNHLVVMGKMAAYPYLPKLWIYHRDSNTGSWQLSDEESFLDASYAFNTHFLATDGEAIAFSYSTSLGVKIAIFRQQSPGVFTRETTFSVNDFPGHSSYNFPSALSLDQDYLVIADNRAFRVHGASGMLYVSKRVDGLWQHLPALMVDGHTDVGSRVSVADGWLVTTHLNNSDSQHTLSLFHLDAQANRRPLISSARPFQIVEGRQFSQTITVSDDDSVNVFLDQAPTWLSVNRSGGDFELSGMVPDSFAGSETVRLRATDSHGVSSYQTFDLEVLESDDIPVVVTLPESGELGVGQSLVLRPVISGTGPFTWQWFKDGVAIEGETGSRLVLDFLTLSDGGAYSFEVTNAVSTTTSENITLEVRPANRFAGDWPMFGNGPRHLGHHPAAFGTHRFFPAWSVHLEERALNRVAVADEKVFVTPYVYFAGPHYARALSLTTGEQVWQKEFENAFSINPPSYHNGRVYVQRGNHSSDTQLWALDAGNGSVAWSAPHFAQWERYESPTVTDEGIWVNGGSYGGMYGFDLDGNERFFENLPQISGWTPTVDNGRLFSWVQGVFKEHHPDSGTELWSIAMGSSGGQNISAVSGNTAVVCSSSELICIDLTTREVRWRVEGAFNYVPAVMGEYAYAISNNSVVSYRLADGEEGHKYTSPSPITSRQPLLVNDHLFVASQTETYVFDLENEDPIQVLPTGGLLSYSQGYLLTAANNGTLSAYFANDVPDFEDQVLADATEDVFYSQALRTVHDDDAEGLTFTLLSGPSWISLTPEGVLEGTLLHTQGGVQTVRVQMSDGVTDPVVKEYVFNGIEVNDRPESTPLESTVDEDAPEFFIALGDYFEDEETLDTDLIYEIVQNDNTTLLSAVLTNDQRMSINCLKDQYGTAVVTVKATDAGGLSVETTVTITVDPVNDRPVFTEDLPDIATDDAGAPRGLDVAPYVFDADPDDSLFYEIVGNTNPSIFGSVTIGGLSGKLQIVFAPYVSGVSDLTIRVTDLEGEYSEQVIRVTLPALPLPGLVAGGIQMNRQTGLYSQVVTVTNNAGRSIGGFLLRVNGLVNGYQVYGMPGNIVRYLTPVAPGESRTFTLEYYSTSSGEMPTPEFVLELTQPEEQDSPETLGVVIEQIYVLEDRSVLLEFVTVPGKRYSVQYSDDLVQWHTSGITVTAAANRTQWLDQGLPRTLCHPSECTSRLYRVLELEDE